MFKAAKWKYSKGGAETLRTFLPILLIESIKPEHIEFLSPMGYAFYRFEHKTFVPGLGHLNTFCIHPSRMGEVG